MTAPAWAARRTEAEQRVVTSALSYRLLDAALTARVHLSLGQPGAVRDQLLRAFDALAELDGALPPDPPAAALRPVPVTYTEESHP